MHDAIQSMFGSEHCLKEAVEKRSDDDALPQLVDGADRGLHEYLEGTSIYEIFVEAVGGPDPQTTSSTRTSFDGPAASLDHAQGSQHTFPSKNQSPASD
ncbi:hypothetical protein [Oceanibaculum pacificum]|nr:hypothetical protein [Oceanibaculum pacificum]